MGAFGGFMRGYIAIADKMKGGATYPGHEKMWGYNILGTIGELAVAKHLNVFFSAGYTGRKSDDVEKYHVRTTAHENGQLLLDKSDPVDKIYILVTVAELPVCKIRGWISGKDVIDHGDLRPMQWGPEKYHFPQQRLNPMECLP